MRECGVNKCTKDANRRIKMPSKSNELQIYFFVCEEHADKIAVKDRSMTVWEAITPQQEIKSLTAERDELKAERSKERIFVDHIKKHLKTMNLPGKVECRICDKTIDEIYEEDSCEH